MDRLIQRFLDFLILTSDFFMARKYNALSRQLGLKPDRSASARRGFIIIQIDALAYVHLLDAMTRGYMPHLKRLAERGELKLERYRSGLPSATPSVQAGIMYGQNFDVPGFRWFEKDTNTAVVCKYPSVVKTFQERVSAGREGILKGGSSYVNLIDGGAERSVFTLSTWRQRGIMSGVKGLGFFFLFLLSPIRFFRVLVYSAMEYVTAVVQRLLSYLGAQDRVRWEVVFPFIRVVCNVIFRETETFGTVIDIFRGVPAIYTTYNGYDEMAHHFGPTARAAYKVLRGIDGEIKQIDRMRRHSPHGRYDLYVLSDHGQTPSTPFQHAYGLTLGELVAQYLARPTKVLEHTGDEYHKNREIAFIIDELEEAEVGASRRLSRLIRRLRRYLARRFPMESLAIDRGVEEEEDVVIVGSSSFANLYFKASKKQLDLSEIEALHPGLVSKLAQHEGIEFVVGRQNGSIILLTGACRVTLDDVSRVNGCRPLERLEEPLVAAEQIRYLASFPHAGDLIVFGAYSHGRVIAFEEQVGGHGGWGGPQAYPFIMYPRRYNIDTARMANARELYQHFAATYLRSN